MAKVMTPKSVYEKFKASPDTPLTMAEIGMLGTYGGDPAWLDEVSAHPVQSAVINGVNRGQNPTTVHHGGGPVPQVDPNIDPATGKPRQYKIEGDNKIELNTVTGNPNGNVTSTTPQPLPGQPGYAGSTTPGTNPGGTKLGTYTTPAVDPNDPMAKLRKAMVDARALIPTRASLTPDAQAAIDPLANQARATLQQDVARKGNQDQQALARQLAARGRIGGPASEALKQQMTSQLNSSLTQGLSGVESTRLQEVNRIVQGEIDRASSFAEKQFTAAAGLIAMGANTDEVLKQMGAAFENDLTKMAIQNRFVAEQAATDRTFRLKLTEMGQEFEKMMTKWKLDEAGKNQQTALIGSIFGTLGNIAMFKLNPLGAVLTPGGTR